MPPAPTPRPADGCSARHAPSVYAAITMQDRNLPFLNLLKGALDFINYDIYNYNVHAISLAHLGAGESEEKRERNLDICNIYVIYI